MSIQQRKEYLSCHELLKDRLVNLVFADGSDPKEECQFLKKFQILFGIKDVKQQIVYIKEICTEVQEVSKRNESALGLELSLEILVDIYLNCSPKHTVKRLLASTFQNFSDDLKTLVSRRMVHEVTSKVTAEVKDIQDGRKIINMIYCLMENFLLGEHCLSRVFLPVLQYLLQALEKFLAVKRCDLSPVEDNEVMHHCLACIQSSSKLLQKCAGSLQGRDSDTERAIQSVSAAYINSIIVILKSEHFLLDCKTSGSMCLTLLLKLNLGPKATELILDVIFHEEVKNKAALPGWILQTSFSRDEISQLSPTSCLCLWFGILAQLDASDLLLYNKDNKSLLVDVMLDRILEMGTRSCDTTGKLQMARTIHMWTSRALACLRSDCCERALTSRLSGPGHLLQKVLKFVWTIWEDSTDVIRFTAKDIFESLIKVHNATTEVEAPEDQFLLDLTKSLLSEVSWSSKGKYGTLRILAESLQVSTLLQYNPDLAQDILSNLKEQTVACYASDLYDKLSTEHLKELSHTDDRKQWQKIWVWPVLQCMMGNSTHKRTYVIEYILPKLLKTGKDTLGCMIASLCNSNQSVTDEQLGALIMCLRRARVMGLLDNAVSQSPECLYGVVKTELVKQALSHTDDQARLDAFALLCENHKTSEPINQSEFRLLKYFIQWNMKNQSPSYRQHMVAHIKKLFLRYKESEGALCRKLNSKNRPSGLDTTLSSYKTFGSWLFQFLLHSLYPGSAFARRTTALSVLSLMVDLLSPANTGGYVIWEEWKGCHIQTLMECLTDTFEDNKTEAYKVLRSCFSQGLYLNKLISLSEYELLDIGLILAASNRPQDCTTGAFLLRILLLQPSVQDFFFSAQGILAKHLSPPAISGGLMHWEQSLRESLQKLPLQQNESSVGTVMLLRILLFYLKDQLQVAKTGLFIAAATKPMYPTLHCIRYILFDVNLKKLSKREMLLWQPLMEDLLICCLEISDIVSPVVQNSSPEGNVPEEAIRGVESIFASEGKIGTSENKVSTSEAERCVETVTLMPEYLVVCCWRNIKEVSLLLGQLTFEAPITQPNTSDIGLLTVQQNEIIGEYFKKQLMESIHRGAFELACAGFVKQCEMLWRCNIKTLHQLPKLWLDQVMTDVKTDDQNNKLCATRRSAGIPFFVQTLVSSEPHSTGRPCFKWTMTELLQLALMEDAVSGTPSNSKVHALNILRALYKDSRLGEVVTPFVADGLMAAILGFQSPFWAVRNSSTLLLSTMITRIFGVKRSKDESTMSKKNCQTGRQFFHQYPSLYPFLLDQLDVATKNISDTDQLHLHPGLYPVLMILGRLFQSPLEGADTSLNLAAFIPYVIRCSSSPVLKTRLMAARALQPLVQKGQLNSVMNQLLDMLPVEPTHAKHSHVHGALVQVLHMLEVIHTMTDEIQSMETSVLTWKDKMWLLTKQNPCYMTKQAAFEVTEKVLLVTEQLSSARASHITREITNSMVQALDEEFLAGIHNKQTLCCVPGFVEYLTVITELDLQITLRDSRSSAADIASKVQYLLGSDIYEVRIVVLDVLTSMFTEHKQRKEQSATTVNCPVTMTTMSTTAIDSVMSLIPFLLERAIYQEQHFECQIKVFKVLDLHPLLEDKDWKNLCVGESSIQILKLCLYLIESSKREELNAAVLRFTRWLIQDILQHWTGDCMETVDSWMAILRDSVGTEKITDLQLSVAMVIQHNALALLRDCQKILGTKKMFEFWEMLTNLQQEDDPEVRDVITATLQLLGNAKAVQPSLTLDYLVRSFVEMHATTKGANCLLTLVLWIINNESSSEGSERLFDKSEMNVFREDVLFYQIILKYCLAIIQHAHFTGSQTEHANNPQHPEPVSPRQRMASDIDHVLSQLNLVVNRGENDMELSNVPSLSESDVIEVLDQIRAFVETKSPDSWSSDKGRPFMKTGAFQESLLDQYKCLVLGYVYKLLSDITGLSSNNDQLLKYLMNFRNRTEYYTYPNCFVSG